MNASIILCTRNRCAALSETLRSLNNVVVTEGAKVELILVDNGSTDDTAMVVRKATLQNMQIQYLHEPNLGKSNALNAGLVHAKGEILVFTDDDVRFDPGWLNEITTPIGCGRFDALVGKVSIAQHLIRPWMSDWHKGWLASTVSLNPDAPEFAVGVNMAASRRVLERVPRFDPELGGGHLGFYEDVLFSMQLKSGGYRLGMAADAVVEHHFDASRLSRSSFLARAVGEGRSQAYVAWHWKHEDRALLSLRVSRRMLELFVKRLFRFRECKQLEGIPVWEMRLVVGIAFLGHFQKLRQQPRAYERFGTRLIKS